MKSDTQKGSYVFPKRDNIWRLLAPSLLGIGVCAMCMVGLTMAWFSSSKTTQNLPVTTTVFEGIASIHNKSTHEVISIDNQGWYSLSKGEYSLSLDGMNNDVAITAGTGFAIIDLNTSEDENNAVKYRSDDIFSLGNLYQDILIGINVQVDCYIKVDFHWGKSSAEYGGSPIELVDDGDGNKIPSITFGSPSPPSSNSSSPETPSSPTDEGQVFSSSSSQSTASSSVSSSAETGSEPQSSKPGSGDASSKPSGGTSSEKPDSGSSSGASSGGAASDGTSSGGTSSAGSSSSSRETEPSSSGASSQPAAGKR